MHFHGREMMELVAIVAIVAVAAIWYMVAQSNTKPPQDPK